MNHKDDNESSQTQPTTKIAILTERLKSLEIEKTSIEEQFRAIRESHCDSKPKSVSKVKQCKPTRVIPIPSKYVHFLKQVCHDCDHNRIRIDNRVKFITHAAHQPRKGTVAYFTEYQITVEDNKGYKYSKESCSLRVVDP